MSTPNTPQSEAVEPPPEATFPDRQATRKQVCHWIRAWHIAHHVAVDESTLRRVTWNGQWIHEQFPAQLESDIFAWGVPEGRGRMMVLDLVRERRNQIKEKSVCLTVRQICRLEEANLCEQKSWRDAVCCNSIMYAVVMRLVALPRGLDRRQK
jgi:hypothetical protein